jgi:hypothetical protein
LGNEAIFYFPRNVYDHNVGILRTYLKVHTGEKFQLNVFCVITEQRFRVLAEHTATGLVYVVMLEEFFTTIRFCRKMALITWYSFEMQHLHIFILHVGWDSLDLVSKEMD